MSNCFVALPENYEKVYLYTEAGEKERQVLWGDWLRTDETQDTDPNWRTVLWAWQSDTKRQRLKIPREHTTATRPLEIVFVDVGQGDGSVLITPERDEDEHIFVIDAGKEHHMYDFLSGRFNTYRHDMQFHAAVLTHPDEDHYYGFKRIFDSGQISFSHLYHNGIVELPTGSSWEKLGGKVKDLARRKSYLTDLKVTHDDMVDTYWTVQDSRRKFTQTIASAIKNNAVGAFQMLSSGHGQPEAGRFWMPGFAPSNGRGYEIEIVGPIVETDDTGAPRLRTFGSSIGKTKNGHSVLLRLTFNRFSILFGGDLNEPAEKFILNHYGNRSSWPRSRDQLRQLVEDAGRRLKSDVMKVCHHGSSDVTDEFLQAVNPLAFVISSGDQEGHVHPRPDLLGRLGKLGRSASPVLLSTELQRSTREKEDERLVARLHKNIERQKDRWTEARAEKIERDIGVLGRSNVSVDGAIYVKTDGERLIAAFKKETDSKTDKWFYFEYRFLGDSLYLVER